jgi:hypothetical protein
MQRSGLRGGLILCSTIAAIGLGCSAPRSVLPDCAIERPNADVLAEQLAESDRIYNGQPALLPQTYEWIKRLDRDLGLWGDDE